MLVLRARLRRAFHPTMWLDAAIGAATIAALTATLAFDPVLADTGGATLEVATDLAYPLADLGLLALVVTLLALTGWRPGLGWAAFALALTAQAVSDVLYAREIALGTDGQDTLLAPVWPAATLLLAYAAWRPLSAPPRSGVPLARVFVFPAVFTSLALGVLVFDHFHAINTLAVVLAATAIALSVARMALSFFDNLRMLRRARQDALTDSLTGLPNRRAFVDDLARLLETGGPVRRADARPLRPRRLQALQRRLRPPGRRRAAAAPVGRARRRRRGPRAGLPARRRRVLPAARGGRQRRRAARRGRARSRRAATAST